jgi:hypothetical protein
MLFLRGRERDVSMGRRILQPNFLPSIRHKMRFGRGLESNDSRGAGHNELIFCRLADTKCVL